jgi:hypothetical protein
MVSVRKDFQFSLEIIIARQRNSAKLYGNLTKGNYDNWTYFG